ncbi:MAG: 2OG-Fe(II) oxygenase [Gammaproteobacteria bacterium]|nr:2OG-Fe(II) oxygenase [Gammaproteobacteria bacterium]
MFKYIQKDAFDQSCQVHQEPFNFVLANNILSNEAQFELDRDYPKYKEAGFLPYNPDECGPSINTFVEELTSKGFSDYVGDMLGIENLHQYPTLITLCHLFNKRFGTIHTDSKSKVATALIYMNHDWPDTSDGCLRFLKRIDDIVVPEIRPIYGNFTIFKRSDNSFHGHLPYEGERRVIQIAWLTSEEEKMRKNKRGRFTRKLKQLFGGWDKKIGAGRDKNKSHM